jgi:hypothetical protein
MEVDDDNIMQQDNVPGPALDGDFMAEVDGAQVRGPGLEPGEGAARRWHGGGHGVG